MEKSLKLLLLGARIRSYRISRNQTLKDLSETCNLSERYLADIERGVKAPKLDTLIRIANTLDVSLDYLLQDSLVTIDKENVALTAFNALKPRQKEILHDIILDIAKRNEVKKQDD